jgi:DNA-binding response OmpR family regulator
MNKPILLLVEDDLDLGIMLKMYLETESFEVVHSESAETAWKHFGERRFDLVILDVNLPGENGFVFAAKLRNTSPEVPFLFLTARTIQQDRLLGLKLGADDYISKPFDAEELVLRIRNILKRYDAQKQEIITVGKFRLDFNGLKLIHPDGVQDLTRREAELLHFLIKRQNSLIPTKEILTELWGRNDYFLGKSMNVFISRLRKYLSKDTSIEIRNVRGEGYELSIK